MQHHIAIWAVVGFIILESPPFRIRNTQFARYSTHIAFIYSLNFKRMIYPICLHALTVNFRNQNWKFVDGINRLMAAIKWAEVRTKMKLYYSLAVPHHLLKSTAYSGGKIRMIAAVLWKYLQINWKHLFRYEFTFWIIDWASFWLRTPLNRCAYEFWLNFIVRRCRLRCCCRTNVCCNCACCMRLVGRCGKMHFTIFTFLIYKLSHLNW